MPKLSAHTFAHIALFIVALIYGGNYIIAKEIMGGGFVPPFALVLMRASTGCICFYILHALFIKEKIQKSDLPKFILGAMLGVAINQTLF